MLHILYPILHGNVWMPQYIRTSKHMFDMLLIIIIIIIICVVGAISAVTECSGLEEASMKFTISKHEIGGESQTDCDFWESEN